MVSRTLVYNIKLQTPSEPVLLNHALESTSFANTAALGYLTWLFANDSEVGNYPTTSSSYKDLRIAMHPVSQIETVEITKIAENAHRYLQIAFAEELYLYCQVSHYSVNVTGININIGNINIGN